MALHFSKQEFEKRKLATLKSMKEQNLDALLMFRQESMFWLTGYDTFGYVFFQTLILDHKGNIILLTRAPDLRQAQNTSNIEDIRIWIDKDQSNPTDDLKIILNELNLKDKKIGQSVSGNTNTVYINPINSLRFVLNELKKDKVNLDKDFYVFTGSTVGVVPILGKGLYTGKVDQLGSAKAIIH